MQMSRDEQSLERVDHRHAANRIRALLDGSQICFHPVLPEPRHPHRWLESQLLRWSKKLTSEAACFIASARAMPALARESSRLHSMMWSRWWALGKFLNDFRRAIGAVVQQQNNVVARKRIDAQAQPGSRQSAQPRPVQVLPPPTAWAFDYTPLSGKRAGRKIAVSLQILERCG